MITKTQLKRFADKVPVSTRQTPYMITDLQIIKQQCHLFNSIFKDVKLFYAIKSFSDDEIIKTVDEYADGYDVASIEEIKKLLSLGIKPARMAFSNPVKSEDAIAEAFKFGVDRFAFQSRSELLKIQRQAAGASVYLRLSVNDAIGAIAFSDKFGADESLALDLLKAAQELGLKPVGLTFHVGSQAADKNAWSDAINKCSRLIVGARNIGIDLNMLNIGGGFPVRYGESDIDINKVAKHINGPLKKLKRDVRGLSIIGEPGRFITADSSVIITSVIGIEERRGIAWLYLDVGAFGAFMEIFEFNAFPYPVCTLKQAEGHKEKADRHYVLTGPTCDSYDTMSLDVVLPSNIQIGDKLVITMAGAYTVVYGSEFNGFNVPPRIFINA